MKRFHKNCDLKTSSRPFCVWNELNKTSIGKWNFWSQLLILHMHWQNYQNLSKSTHRPPQISPSFLQRIPSKLKSFQATFFVEVFDKNFSFVMLHKLANFHHQIVFTSQVIHLKVFRVLWLGIWWHHDTWISEQLKSDYLKNEKSIPSEIKNIFSCFKSSLF